MNRAQLCAVALFACSGPTSVESSAPDLVDTAALDGGPTTSVVYTLAWTEPGPGVTPRDGGGWVFETDAGFTVELTSGSLVAYSSWLTECPTTEFGLWLPWVGTVAHAGHSVLSNATSSLTPVVEDLAAPVDQSLPIVEFEPSSYCEVSTLIARGDQHTSPVDHDMDDVSLRIAGTWRQDDGPATAFAIETPIAHSGGVDLVATGTGPHLEIRVERTLTGLFDGIDFTAESDARIARAVLANLVDRTKHVAVRTP